MGNKISSLYRRTVPVFLLNLIQFLLSMLGLSLYYCYFLMLSLAYRGYFGALCVRPLGRLAWEVVVLLGLGRRMKRLVYPIRRILVSAFIFFYSGGHTFWKLGWDYLSAVCEGQGRKDVLIRPY